MELIPMELIYRIFRDVSLWQKKRKEVKLLIKEALEFHIEGMKLESKRIPKARIKTFEMEVAI
jgi:hypothetical protein